MQKLSGSEQVKQTNKLADLGEAVVVVLNWGVSPGL